MHKVYRSPPRASGLGMVASDDDGAPPATRRTPVGLSGREWMAFEGLGMVSLLHRSTHPRPLNLKPRSDDGPPRKKRSAMQQDGDSLAACDVDPGS